MRLFSEKVNPTFNSSGYNILTVKDYTEVFFDVYEFEINGSKFVAEKTGALDDAPIISIPVDYNNVVENYDFVLHKGEQSIHFDPSTHSTPSQIKSIPPVIPFLTESIEEETDEVFLEEKKSAILEEIEKAKIAAAKYIKSIEKQNKRELVSYQTEREIALKEDIEKQKKILLDEFYSFVDQLKDRIAEESSDTALELKDIISEQLTSVSKDIDTRLSSAEKAIDTKLEERANELLNDVLLSEVKRSGKEIADDLNNQVKTIAENISKSLISTRKQIEVDINEKIQEISTELNAKDKAIVELNDTLTKQSNRALSRIGTVKTQLESTVQDVVNSLEARIETASDRLEKYYAEKLQLVESSMTNVSEETKKHIISLIKESHQSLQADIANIKVTVPNIVIEKSNGNQEIDVAALRTELEKSVSNRFVNEISSLKRLIELSSGGGSVAMQFAAGGTMQGNLTVVGTISASQYLGIPGGSATGAYLPLSGGTVTGDVSVSGLLSATSISISGVQAATVNSNVASATVLQTPRLINGVSFNGSSDITVTVPISSGVTGLGSGISAFLATPTADNLRNAVTQETGTGSLVFADLPSLSGATIANGTYTYNDATAAAHRTSLSLDRYYIPYGLNQQCSTVVYDFDNAMPPFNVGVTSSTPAGGLGQVTNAGGTHWNSKVKGWYHIANGSTNNAISELSFAGPQAYQGGTGTPTAWNNYTLVYVFCCPVLTDVDIRFGLRLGNVARIIQIFQDNTVSPGSSPIFNVFTSNGTYTTTGLATGALSGAPTPQAGSYITGTGTRYAFVFDTSQRAGGTSTSVQLKTFSGSVSGDLTLSATYELTGWNPVSGGAGPYVAVRNLNSRAGQATSLHVDTVIWKTWNHKTDILPAEILNILLTT